MDTLKKEIRKTSNINAAMLLLMTGLTIVLAVIAGYAGCALVGEESEMYEAVVNAISLGGQNLIVIPLVLVLFRKKLNAPIGECFCKPQMSGKWIAKHIVIALFLIYGTAMLSNTLFALLQSASGLELHAVDFTPDGTAADKVVMFICIAILAPLFEELLFRAALYRNAARYGAWSMVIIVGILFGLYHANYAQTFYTAVLGICTCFLVAKTGSIYPSMIVHTVMNTIGAVQNVLSSGLDQEKILAQDMEYIQQHAQEVSIQSAVGWVLIVIMIVGGILFIRELIWHRDSFHLEHADTGLSGGKTAALYLTAPVTVVLILLLAASTISNALL